MNIFKKKKTLPSTFTVIKQKTEISSWWGSGHQGKHFEKVIRDKTSFRSSF